MVAYTLVLSVRVLKNRVVQQAKSPRVCFVVHLFNQHKEEKIGDRAVLENFAPFGIQEAAASLYMGIRGFSGRLGLWFKGKMISVILYRFLVKLNQKPGKKALSILLFSTQ